MNKQFKKTRKNLKHKSLDELLEEIIVLEKWENLTTPSLNDWFAVTTDLGIIGYFKNKKEAFMFRLNYINRIMNT